MDKNGARRTEDEPRETFFALWKRATFHPAELFEHPVTPRRWSPVAFAVVVGAVASSAGALVRGMMEGSGPAAIGGAIGGFLLGALLAVPALYLEAALLHLALVVLRAKPGPLRTTVTCVAYTSSPSLFGVLPIVGVPVGVVWRTVTLIIGLSRAHRVGIARPLVAALLVMAMPILLALGLRAGVVEAFRMPSGSMTPTLVMGDHIFINKLAFSLRPRRGDLMVFRFPENKAQDFLKRAIALPGDTLEVLNGRPVLSGRLVPHCRVGTLSYDGRLGELFVEHLGDRSYLTLFDSDPDQQSCSAAGTCEAGLTCRAGICGTLQGPWQVPAGEVWVMGDNRNNSHDSRSWRGGLGAGVPFEDIKGRVSIVWMSFGPGGGVAQDRLFLDVHGRPHLPPDQAASLGPALERCLRERERAVRNGPLGAL